VQIDPVTGKARCGQQREEHAEPGQHRQQRNLARQQQAHHRRENMRAGVVPGGGVDENSERTAQAIASGQLPAPTGMALLNPKNQRILGRVMEINPQYDATTVTPRRRRRATSPAARRATPCARSRWPGSTWTSSANSSTRWTTATCSWSTRSATLYSQQTGNPAVTNFDAAKEVVSKEV
jgi:hypothetical protein